jgi:YVTN family beta-propeller protein
VATTPNGSAVYAANSGSTTVSVINTGTNTVTATISGLDGPDSVAIGR